MFLGKLSDKQLFPNPFEGKRLENPFAETLFLHIAPEASQKSARN